MLVLEKMQTTKHTVAKGVQQMKKVWLGWKNLRQEKIQQWIERIPEHIKKTIDCGGGNGHKDLGRSGGGILTVFIEANKRKVGRKGGGELPPFIPPL